MKLMRQLEIDHKNYWDKKEQVSPKMIDDSDCDPTLLSGWTDHDISLWDVSAIDGKPCLEEILCAICRNKKDWKRISYLQFSIEAVDAAGLVLTPSPGKTSDQIIDNSETHLEIKGITGKELCTLLFNIYQSNHETGIYTKNQYDKVLLDVFDRTKDRQFAFSSTTQPTNITNPTSGSGIAIEQPVITHEPFLSEDSSNKELPKPSSSTIDD